MYQYVDPHNEGTFVSDGTRYYLSELYGKQIGIIKPITFYPMGTLKADAKVQTVASGKTHPVYSSAHLDGKIILLFDVPNLKPEQLQFYCFLDTEAMMFPPGMKSKGKVDEHDFQLEQKIQEQVAYSKLDTLGKIWYQIKPYAIPALIVIGIFQVRKFTK